MMNSDNNEVASVKLAAPFVFYFACQAVPGSAATGCSQSSSSGSGGEIKIGAAAPISGSAAMVGGTKIKEIEPAAEEINAAASGSGTTTVCRSRTGAFQYFWGYAIDKTDLSLVYNYKKGDASVVPPTG